MPVVINPMPAPIDEELLARYRGVSFPTLGHYLEAGATTGAIAAVWKPVKIVGRAITVRTVSPDSTLVHHVMDRIGPGEAAEQIAVGGVVPVGTCAERQ